MKMPTAERLRYLFGHRPVAAGQCHARRQAERDLLREGRPRKHGHRRLGQGLSDHFGHQRAGPVLDTFRTGHDGRSRPERRTHLFGDAAQKLRRHRHENEVSPPQAAGEIGAGADAGLEGSAGQENRIAPAAIDRIRDLGFPGPDRHVQACAPRRTGEGGSERSGSDDRYLGHSALILSFLDGRPR